MRSRLRELVLGPTLPDVALRQYCTDRRLGRPAGRHLCSLFVSLHWLVLYPLCLFIGGETPPTDYIDFPANWIVYDFLKMYGERAFAVWVIVATVTYGALGWLLGALYDYRQCRRFQCAIPTENHYEG